MFCTQCMSLLEINRSLHNLFAQIHHSICYDCIFSDLQLVDEVLIVPLNEGYLMCIIDLLTNISFNEQLYFSYLSSYFDIIRKYNNHFTILYFDEFNENLYNLIDEARLGNIIIVTLKTRGEILL